MVLLRLIMLLEEGAVELERRRQVVEGLLIVLVVQIRLSELGVGSHEDEQVLAMDVDKNLADSELLHADLDLAIEVLREEEFVELLVFL